MSEASYATSKLAVSADDVEPRMILRRHARAQAPFTLMVNQSLTEIGKREIKKIAILLLFENFNFNLCDTKYMLHNTFIYTQSFASHDIDLSFLHLLALYIVSFCNVIEKS